METNWFQCRLCPARTKFVKDCIAPHLKMSHNMDIEDYERNIMQPEDWPYEVIPEPSLKHEMRGRNLTTGSPTSNSLLKSNVLAGRNSSGAKNLLQRNLNNSDMGSELAGGGDRVQGGGGSERDKWNR